MAGARGWGLTYRGKVGMVPVMGTRTEAVIRMV